MHFMLFVMHISFRNCINDIYKFYYMIFEKKSKQIKKT